VSKAAQVFVVKSFFCPPLENKGANMSVHKNAVIHIGNSSLGWLGIVEGDSGLRRVTFGHPSRIAVRKFLTNDLTSTSDAILSWSTEEHSLLTRLQEYADGAPDDFLDVALDDGTLSRFQRGVIEQCRRVAYGSTASYGQLAKRCGHPGAARAVGSTMASNRWPLIVPCHRVVQASGQLGNYSAPQGVRMKRRLLDMETAVVLV
jgi:methylated-DNA-[protein]-cysteine S-methyltransferase